MISPDPARYIDLERYPVDRAASPEYAALLDRVRAISRMDGYAALKGFVRSAGAPIW